MEQPPKIPEGLDDVLYYKLASKEYYNRLKSLVWIFIQIMGTLLVLGIIWINIDWVKIIVTAVALSMAFMLFLVLINIF